MHSCIPENNVLLVAILRITVITENLLIGIQNCTSSVFSGLQVTSVLSELTEQHNETSKTDY